MNNYKMLYAMKKWIKAALEIFREDHHSSSALGSLHLSWDMRLRKSHYAPLRKKECCQLVVRYKMELTIKPVWISQMLTCKEKKCTFQNWWNTVFW